LKVEAVLFDLFDTLLLIKGGDAFYIPSLKRLHGSLVKNGVNVSFEEFKRVYFEVRDSIYAENSKSLKEPHFKVRVWKTLQKLGYNYELPDSIVSEATEAFCEEFAHYITPDKKAIYALEKLHGKYRLGIISNFALPEFARKMLEKFQLKKYFDTIVISAEINKRKPSLEIFRKALSEIKVEPSKAVMVGDTPDIDIVGAKRAGMKAILIDRETFAADRPTRPIMTVKPDKIIKSMEELPNTIEDC
jgi:putative hydrolase of the HAD superfamily